MIHVKTTNFKRGERTSPAVAKVRDRSTVATVGPLGPAWYAWFHMVSPKIQGMNTITILKKRW